MRPEGVRSTAPHQVNKPRGGPWVWVQAQAEGLRGGKTGRKCGRGGVLALEQSRLPHREMPAPDSLPGLPPCFLKPGDSLSTVWPEGALPLARAASSRQNPHACLLRAAPLWFTPLFLPPEPPKESRGQGCAGWGRQFIPLILNCLALHVVKPR